ncbi:hypothetical protein P7K49_002753 [Saguinus oedipus]|uniref:Uncharacterized protein n=1 Tax=Saguinus oedipus TaxID=9490 RepID=A0ABQ9WI75_SAGOE|nr:hypothetical protein P7K49_002753 [Saguinus oedipus]
MPAGPVQAVPPPPPVATEPKQPAARAWAWMLLTRVGISGRYERLGGTASRRRLRALRASGATYGVICSVIEVSGTNLINIACRGRRDIKVGESHRKEFHSGEPVPNLLFLFSQPMEEEASSKEDSAPSKPVVGIIYPPPEVRNIVDKTASFVAR